MKANENTTELYTLFKTFLKKVGEEWKARSLDYNLPLSHFRLLMFLHYRGKQKTAALADCLQVTPGAVTGIADKLLQRGLVERERDEQDRRVVYLRLTEEGETAVQSLHLIEQQLYDDIITQLDPHDIGHMTRIFNTMIQVIDTHNQRQG
ncbi:MarR family winged helix-turn-helix transcriptional regulator [Paenibacillus sp. SYP-B4298]|uniref:MarR family winged helix-turn-helix transcriptional regulator n=1 Tax=Paenibacillus sp. SYP-B4298 TaxID=2996034 RepID=UPI0022DE21B0|nr:MarR family transcriptional regulator [Paenibacillus sp. SYP-B4298]